MQTITEQPRPTSPAVTTTTPNQDNTFIRITEAARPNFSALLSPGDMKTLRCASKDLLSYIAAAKLSGLIDHAQEAVDKRGTEYTTALVDAYRYAMTLGVEPSKLKSTQQLLAKIFLENPSNLTQGKNHTQDNKRMFFKFIMNGLYVRAGLDGNEKTDLPITEFCPPEQHLELEQHFQKGYHAGLSIQNALKLAQQGKFDEAHTKLSKVEDFIAPNELDSRSRHKFNQAKALIESRQHCCVVS